MSKAGSFGIDDWNTSSDYSALAFTPPHRPGTSEYCIKGLAYRGFLDDCERTVPGGRAGFLEAIRQPELRAFFEQEFLAASWFDVFPLPLGRQIATRLAGKTHLDHVRAQMRQAAQRDIQGVHRGSMDVELPPEVIVERIERVTNQYFNFAPVVRGKMLDPCRREAFRDDFPELLAPWYRAVVEGYTGTVLELCGAREIKVRSFATPQAPKDGLALVSLRYECSWSPKAPA